MCSKNITHKRMTSQYKNPRVLLLAGSLEYQRVAGQLASFNTLLQQVGVLLFLYHGCIKFLIIKLNKTEFCVLDRKMNI